MMKIQLRKIILIKTKFHDGIINICLQISAWTVAEKLSISHFTQLSSKHQACFLGSFKGVIIHAIC